MLITEFFLGKLCKYLNIFWLIMRRKRRRILPKDIMLRSLFSKKKSLLAHADTPLSSLTTNRWKIIKNKFSRCGVGVRIISVWAKLNQLHASRFWLRPLTARGLAVVKENIVSINWGLKKQNFITFHSKVGRAGTRKNKGKLNSIYFMSSGQGISVFDKWLATQLIGGYAWRWHFCGCGVDTVGYWCLRW